MSINKILEIAAQTEAETFTRVSPRRGLLKTVGSKLAAAAIPMAGLFAPQKAQAQTNDSLHLGLFAILRLKYMTAAFYAMASTGEAVENYPAEVRDILRRIADDEAKHVKYINDFLMSTHGSVPPKPYYDFTGSGAGPYATVFTNYAMFLTLAQVFEDTCVRAIKGQFSRFNGNIGSIQEFVATIHTVDARHSTMIRMMRKNIGIDIKPWITDNNRDIPNNFTQRTYNSESIHIQANIDLTNINGYTITREQVTQAFDEPLLEADLDIIMQPFIVA